MKTGLSLTELAQKIENIHANKKDYRVPVSAMGASVATDGKLRVSFAGNGLRHDYKLNNWSQSQLAAFANVPNSYLDRLAATNPELAAENINHGLMLATKDDPKAARLIRTFEGNTRAVLSPSYLLGADAHDLFSATLPAIMQSKLKLLSAEITEKKVYAKFSSDKLTGEIKKGDPVEYGLVISTSDVGAGAWEISPFINRLACLNGMILPDANMKRRHIGKRTAVEEFNEVYMTDRSRNLAAAALFAKSKDLIEYSLRVETFEAELERMRRAAGLEIKNNNPLEVVELACEQVGVTNKDHKNSILAALASGNEGAGYTQWGLVNAFTRAANNQELDYETATGLELAGGKILSLTESQWRRIAA